MSSIIAEYRTRKTGTEILGIRLAWISAAEAGVPGTEPVVQLLFLRPPASERSWIGRRPQSPAPTWEPVTCYDTPDAARAAANKLWRIHEL